MDTWLPETGWATCKREIKDNPKVTSSWFLIHTELRCTVNHTPDGGNILFWKVWASLPNCTMSLQKTSIFIVIVVCTWNLTWLVTHTHTHTHTHKQEERVRNTWNSLQYYAKNEVKTTVFLVLTPCIPVSNEPAASVFKFHQPGASSFRLKGCRVIPRLTKIIRSGIIFVSRNVISP